MFPDVIRFHWKVRKDGNWVDVQKSDCEVLESSFSDKTRTSMMIIDKKRAEANRYACFYTHMPNSNGKEKPLELKKGTTLLFFVEFMVYLNNEIIFMKLMPAVISKQHCID